MKKTLSRAIFRIAGWSIGPTEGAQLPKCVICVAPHTSNWDFVLGKLFYTSIGCTASFLIKKEWFVFPFSYLFKALGGVPIDRSKRTSVTEQMVAQFQSRTRFQLAITPEGTRKAVQEWKKGFYYIALSAEVPIVLGYLDYGKKEVGFKTIFYPTGDADKDIAAIQEHYKGIKGRNPHNFTMK